VSDKRNFFNIGFDGVRRTMRSVSNGLPLRIKRGGGGGGDLSQARGCCQHRVATGDQSVRDCSLVSKVRRGRLRKFWA
jgi:hypothetical protein